MLAALLPLVSPLKWVVYLLPFLGLSALILGRYANSPLADLATLHEVTTLLAHASPACWWSTSWRCSPRPSSPRRFAPASAR